MWEGDPACSAGIVTLSDGKRVVYKYDDSNIRMNNPGGMPFLEEHSVGRLAVADEFDFGRSDIAIPGLIALKDHWATRSSTRIYWRSQAASSSIVAGAWKTQVPKKLFARLPDAMQAGVGKPLYRLR